MANYTLELCADQSVTLNASMHWIRERVWKLRQFSLSDDCRACWSTLQGSSIARFNVETDVSPLRTPAIHSYLELVTRLNSGLRDGLGCLARKSPVQTGMVETGTHRPLDPSKAISWFR